MDLIKKLYIWEYDPVNFFEKTYECCHEKYSLRIGDGKIFADVSKNFLNASDTLEQEIYYEIIRIMNSRMVIKHSAYKVGHLNIQQHYSDGTVTNDYKLKVDSAVFVVTGYAPDILIKNSKDEIVVDTKAERLNKEDEMIKSILGLKKNRSILEKLLHSYESAIKHPDHELVHLYEIKECLSEFYGKL